MRVEIYGCSYEGQIHPLSRILTHNRNLDGLMSYSIPQGDRRGYNTQFFDEIYDGKNDKGVLTGGLGQLTDGIFGQSDYRLTDHEQSGYDWMGWKNRSSISLFFHFDTLRNFTSIHLHTSNFFPHHIYLFHSIIIDTCTDVNHHQMMEFLIPQDETNSSARIVEILLDNNNSLYADCLNLTLIANNQSEWILISEIQFHSIPIPTKSNLIKIGFSYLNYSSRQSHLHPSLLALVSLSHLSMYCFLDAHRYLSNSILLSSNNVIEINSIIYGLLS